MDADTIKIDQTRIRLYGIDAPEAGQADGKDASTAIAKLIEGKEVRCEGSKHDDYQRLLAICHIGADNINAEMVRTGWAWAFVKYDETFVAQEKEARNAHVGIWRSARGAGPKASAPEPPWEYRARRWQVEEQVAPNGCPIKGNISLKGERVYHVPWSPAYSKTRVSESKGERWFCSEAEALAAGWREPYWR